MESIQYCFLPLFFFISLFFLTSALERLRGGEKAPFSLVSLNLPPLFHLSCLYCIVLLYEQKKYCLTDFYNLDDNDAECFSKRFVDAENDASINSIK